MINAGDRQRSDDDDRAKRVGQEVLEHNAAVFRANTAGGFDEIVILQGQHLPAHDARLTNPVHDRQGDKQQEQPVEQVADKGIAQRHHDHDKEQQVWEGIDHIGQAHQQVIPTPAVIASQQANRGADQQDDHGRDQSQRSSKRARRKSPG